MKKIKMTSLIKTLFAILLITTSVPLLATCDENFLGTANLGPPLLISYIPLELTDLISPSKNQLILKQPSLKERYLNQQSKQKQAFNISGNNIAKSRPQGSYLEILNVNIEEKQFMKVYLMEDSLRVRHILSVALSYYNKNTGGISTVGSLHVRWDGHPTKSAAIDKLWPIISLTQTSLPRLNDSKMRPGPPLKFEFHYKSKLGCYQKLVIKN